MKLQSVITRLLPFSVLGAIVATLCDANHVFTETLSYPEPFLFGQAIFVLPGFFVAFDHYDAQLLLSNHGVS